MSVSTMSKGLCVNDVFGSSLILSAYFSASESLKGWCVNDVVGSILI